MLRKLSTKTVFWLIIAAFVIITVFGIGLVVHQQNLTPSMRWAKNLKVQDVESIEFLCLSTKENERYKKYEPKEFSEIVKLVNQSRGKHIEAPGKISGTYQTFYITTADGIVHCFSNNANVYLEIDGQSYEAPYPWLGGKWNFSGNAPEPDDFLAEGTVE